MPQPDYRIPGAEIANVRKTFHHPLLIIKSATMRPSI